MSETLSKSAQSVLSVVTNLETEITRLKGLLEDEFPAPIKDMVKLPKLDDFKVSGDSITLYTPNVWFKFKNYWSDWKELETVEQIEKRKSEVANAIGLYQQALQALLPEEERIFNNNTMLHQKVTELMKRLGVADIFYKSEYKTSRSTRPTSVQYRAGYLEDLDRIAPKSRQVTALLNSKPKELLSTLQRQYEEVLRKAQEKERAKIREQQEAEKVHQLALLRAKYTPDNAMSDADDILDGILAKDKYLRLAHYLQMNRNDWNDGYSFAGQGLRGFDVETSEDSEIVSCLQEIINKEDSPDGRYFRDCKYSYSYLFGKVEDTVLYDDYRKVESLIERY